MSKIKDKVKEKVTDAKDKVIGASDKTVDKSKEGVSSTTRGTSANADDTQFEEGGPGTEVRRKDDPLTQYREKEPMTPAKIKEHEPTAVKREMTEKISDSGQTNPSGEDPVEKARRSGMTKGTAGASDTGDESEQGAAGTNK
jgi:hypothetical protein